MIRYATLPNGLPITLKTLEAAIKADATGHADPEVRKAVRDWVEKAKARTKQLLDAGAYIDSDKWQRLSASEKEGIAKPIDLDWSSVKYLFMKIQNNKCAYCERRFAPQTSRGGTAEHDVDHFRPKNPIKEWKDPKDGSSSGGSGVGYYWLAFHLLNYCTACTTFNSGFKSNYFPVAGKRLRPPAGPTTKAAEAERPLLIYPIGNVDEDPEKVVGFLGLAAFPVEKRPDLHLNHRARVTIEFFGLNRREELLWGRAERLRDLEKALVLINKGTALQKIPSARQMVRESG